MAAFHLLVVCTGNICRSPAAELLLRQGLYERTKPGTPDCVAVSSAGLGCDDGWPVDPPVAELLHELHVAGGDDLRSRVLRSAIISNADLVLTATRQHRFHIGEHWPAAYRRTFTLGEASELLQQADLSALPASPYERGCALVDWLADERSVRQISEGSDLADPHGRRPADYRDMMQRLVPMTETILEALAPHPPA